MVKYGKTKFKIVGMPVRVIPGKSQQEINSQVLERALKAKPNLRVCPNHSKHDFTPTNFVPRGYARLANGQIINLFKQGLLRKAV
jgi:hypothetical protein